MNIGYTYIENLQFMGERNIKPCDQSEEKYDVPTTLNLSFGARILKSEFELPLSVDRMSCINRSKVGKYFGFGAFSYLADCRVGRFCSFASRVSVGAFSHPIDWLSIHEFQYRDMENIFGDTARKTDSEYCKEKRSLKTIIGNDVWIADNAVVLKGVEIGHGAVVGAGSVVTKDVEPYLIVAGNPAKVLKKRFSEKQIIKLLDLKWWDMDLSELGDLDFRNVDRSIEMLEHKR